MNLSDKSKKELIEEIILLKKQLQEQNTGMTVALEAGAATPKSQELIELVNENSHDLIFIHKLDGHILAINKALQEFLPVQKPENMRDLLVLEVRHMYDKYLKNIEKSGLEKGYMKVADKNGQERILKYYNKLVKHPGEEPFVQGLAHDITDLWLANKKLKSSEESYRKLFDASEEPIFILAQNGTILNANSPAEYLYRHNGSSLIGEPYDKICFSDTKTKSQFYDILKAAWTSPFQKMEWWINKDTTHASAHEITLRKGTYMGSDVIISYLRDITERKFAEQKLREEVAVRESEKRLHKVFDKVNLFVFTIDKDSKIRFINNSFLKLIGAKKTEIIGKDFFSLFENDQEEEKQQRDSFSHLTEDGDFLNRFEKRLISKYGDVRTLQFNVVMITDARGDISGISVVGEDVTENTRVIRALRDSNKKLQDLFDNANDLIQVLSSDFNFLFVNNVWKNALGYTDEEITKLKFKDIIAPEYKKATLAILERIKTGEKIETFDTVFITKSKKTLYVAGSVNCKFINGQPSEYRGIFYDNTYKVRAERAQNLYYGISNLAIQADNLEVLFTEIHKILKEHIDVNNFHVTLYDKDKTILNFPYYVDENFPGVVTSTHRKIGHGLTEYSLASEKPVFLYEEEIVQLIAAGKLDQLERIPKIWMGVPLRLENRTIGLIAVKSYSDRNKYRQRHLEMLDFVSGQIAFVIERKRNEEKIHNQSARLQAIFESSSHLMWSINKKQELTSFNQNYADSIFYHHGVYPELDIAVVEPRLLLSGEEYRDYINEVYQKAFDGAPQHYETSIQDKNNRLIWRETYLNPFYAPDGTIQEVSGITHDITEKKNFELVLQESEVMFRNIFESFQDIYYRTDMDGKIIMISPSSYELTGYLPDEMIGKDIAHYYVNPKKQKNLLKELLRTGTVRNFEINIKTKSDHFIQTISNIRLIYNNQNEPIAIDGVARDITYLKRASEDLLTAKEVAEKSLKVKELFLANMSHEIRTPMNGIIGMIDLLSGTMLNDEQQDYVNTVKKSSQTLLVILNDILDLSKLEAGKMQLRSAPCSIEQTIDKLHALFSQQAKAKGIDFTYELTPDVPPVILTDETRLLQVFANLISNSLKFTDKGKVHVKIERLRGRNNKHLLKAEVSDTGIGISKENLRLLFDAFSQIDNSSKKSYGGTGLGLAISKQICTLMNGDIGVRSQEGKGSTFWFTFETESTDLIPEVEEINVFADISQQLKSLQAYILLVDDNSINQKVASDILKKAGCIVDIASNGLEAIEKVKQNAYQLVFMDIQMPVMDGVEATAQIKKLALPSIPPIIAMTAYSMKEDKQRFMDAGMDDYLSKPIRLQNLIKKVAEWLKPELLKPQALAIEKETTSVPKNVFNNEVVKQLKNLGGIDMVSEIMSEFEKEAYEIIENCKSPLENDDFKLLLGNLHTLKGTSATLGIEQISFWAAHIEKNIKNDIFTGVKTDFSLLEDAYKIFQEAIKTQFTQPN